MKQLKYIRGNQRNETRFDLYPTGFYETAEIVFLNPMKPLKYELSQSYETSEIRITSIV
jgi:hypothetical protein